jgi:hypothetical protein
MEIVIGIRQAQESLVRLGSTPAYCRSFDWIIERVLTVSTVSHQAASAIFWIECALPALSTANLQMALQVCIVEVRALVVG